MSQLNADCLNEIFEYFDKDKITLHSCLLVNRLWCKIIIRILWTSVWNYDTLIACLPDESKEILYKIELLLQPQLRNLHHLIIQILLKWTSVLVYI